MNVLNTSTNWWEFEVALWIGNHSLAMLMKFLFDIFILLNRIKWIFVFYKSKKQGFLLLTFCLLPSSLQVPLVQHRQIKASQPARKRRCLMLLFFSVTISFSLFSLINALVYADIFKTKKISFVLKKLQQSYQKAQFIPRNIIVLEFILRKRTFSHLKHLETSVLLDLRLILLIY